MLSIDDADGRRALARRLLRHVDQCGRHLRPAGSPVADVWNTYLKPRSVIWSEYENVSHRQLRALGHLGHGERERADSYAPAPATTSGASATMRCAAFLAFSTLSPASKHHQLHPGAAERLDAALLVDRFDGEVGALLHHLALARPGARHAVRSAPTSTSFFGRAPAPTSRTPVRRAGKAGRMIEPRVGSRIPSHAGSSRADCLHFVVLPGASAGPGPEFFRCLATSPDTPGVSGRCSSTRRACLGAPPVLPRAHSPDRHSAVPRPRAAPPAAPSSPPASWIATMRSKISSTIGGARPIDGSSSISSFGDEARPRAMASICCWPPDNAPASCLRALGEHRKPRVDVFQVPLPVARPAVSVYAPISRFSNTVSEGNTCRPSGTWAMPRCGRAAGATASRSAPSNRIAPGQWRHDARDGLEQRRLAGAVRPDDGDEFARHRLRPQRRAAPDAAVARAEGVDLKHPRLQLLAQVGFDHRGIARDGFRRALGQHRAVIQHDETVDQPHHGLHGVLDDDDGDALGGEPAHDGDDVLDVVAAQPGQRFVEQQELGLGPRAHAPAPAAAAACWSAPRRAARLSAAMPTRVDAPERASCAPRRRKRVAQRRRRRRSRATDMRRNGRTTWKVRPTPAAQIW